MSLQNVSRLQDVTSNRLATGLKVNSAIDNPSSFYTAQSLTNRASDLNALLDSMSQGVQTLKAVSQSLESAAKFLQQAKAVANQAMDGALVKKAAEKIDYSQYTQLSKDWYTNQVGADGVVVETAQELKDAITSGTKTIVVYGKIDFTNQSLTLAGNQKIVGTEFFANINRNALYRDSTSERFSQINFINTAGTNSSGLILSTDADISDLKVSLKQPLSYNDATVRMMENSTAHNVDIINSSDTSQASGIIALGSNNKLTGIINISTQKKSSDFGVYALNGGIEIDNAILNIDSGGFGIIIGGMSSAKIENSVLNMKAQSGLFLNAESQGGNTMNIGNNVIINAQSKNILSIGNSSVNNPITGRNENIVNITAGTKVYWHEFTDGAQHNAWSINNATTLRATNLSIAVDEKNFSDLVTGISEITDYHNYQVSPTNSSAYRSILDQFNALINDSSYKGVNLLKEDSLKINFNEDRSSAIDVKGVDASTTGLGLNRTAWISQADIDKSITELDSAIGKIRSYASEFGNYYNIVATREDFTKAMINVLEEGSDKLTLADMNQESANMLALQTRQQLAINSLSLASQASQSVLKLF